MKDGWFGHWLPARDVDIECPAYVESAVSLIKRLVLDSFGNVKCSFEDESVILRQSSWLFDSEIGTIGWKAKFTFETDEVPK